MAIVMAFETSEVEVIGLTTIFGNVTTEDATRNALLLASTSPRLMGILLRLCCLFF